MSSTFNDSAQCVSEPDHSIAPANPNVVYVKGPAETKGSPEPKVHRVQR